MSLRHLIFIIGVIVAVVLYRRHGWRRPDIERMREAGW